MLTKTKAPHFLNGSSIDDDTWEALVESAVDHRHGRAPTDQPGAGRSIALMFFNPSLRTRTSMELAATQLGAHATTLVAGQGTWNFAWDEGGVMDGGEAEHISEAIGVLSRYYDVLGVRVFASGTDYEQDRTDTRMQQIGDIATVPVINLESAFYHPCQALADAATLTDHFDGAVEDKRFVLTWTYHPKALPMAVPNSALLMAARLGMDVTVARPSSHALDASLVDEAAQVAQAQGGSVATSEDIDAAVEDADVVYAKSWGGPLLYTEPDREAAEREAHRHWRVTADRMIQTNDGIFMHCLPARRNVVVDDAVLDGPQARHLLQSEYRLHAQKALLARLWEEERGKR